MVIKITFSDSLRRWIGEIGDMEVSAATVHQALFHVARAYPALHMFNCEGELRSILRVYKNGEPARVTDALQDGDTLEISVAS